MSDTLHQSIETECLILRLPMLADAPAIKHYANEWEIAKNTLNLPHPYEDDMAEQFIERVLKRDNASVHHTFAIVRQTDQQFIGMCGLDREPTHQRGEIGYWIGKPFWGKGYATEAARALVN